MAFRDLREWIEFLREQGELLTVSENVSTKETVGAVCRYLIDRGPNKAVLFTSVEGHSIPVFANSFSTRERLNAALGVTPENRMQFIMECWEKAVSPIIADKAKAPVKEIVRKGKEASFYDFPIPWHNRLDGGPYISFGVLICRDEQNGHHNLSYQRLQIKSAKRAGINVEPGKHARKVMDRAYAENREMPVAIAIGLAPSLNIAAAASPPWGVNEYELAGALLGEPVELVSAETSDLLVPAHAEIVLEGVILPNVAEEEGPFAEFTGHYGTVGPRSVFELRAVTMRQNPIYHTLYTGMPICDNHVIQELLRAAKVWEGLKKSLPNITDVYCPPQAGNGFTVYIAMKKRHDGEPKLAMMAAWTSFHYVKHVIVVDDDIDIHDPVQREWVVATRVQADKDVLIIPGMVGHVLDPSAQGTFGVPARLGVQEVPRGTRAVMGIDATRPLGVDFPPVARVHPERLEQAKEIVSRQLALNALSGGTNKI